METQEDPRFRDHYEALRLAEEACQRINYRDANALLSLAAAQAAGGRYSEAGSTAERASKVASAAGQVGLVKQIEEQMRCYQEGKPFIARAPLRLTAYASVPARRVDEW